MSFMTSDEMTTGSVHASDAERKWLAARTRWWNSTGGGSRTEKKAGVTASVKGIGAVKAGDGGVKFRAEWPELDSENFDWMKKHRIDPATGNLIPDEAGKATTECAAEVAALVRGPRGSGGLGAVRDGGQAAREAGTGWISRHKWKVIAAVVFTYVVLSRMVGEGA